MTFQEFRRLISKGETATIDFKLTCNAFDRNFGDHEKAKAELVKDICAMANNAPAISYLIIGVSDDRKHCESVLNAKLTSSNIQTLIRDSIHPHPKVRVYERCWSKAPLPFKNQKLVIIQIGPNAKEAYRFNRDYIQPGSGYNFRKNQVWVRNQDTSDIATPEQIVRLKTKRPTQDEEVDGVHNIEYDKLQRSDKARSISKDLQQIFRDQGFRLVPVKRTVDQWEWGSFASADFRAVGKINNKKFTLLCCVRTGFSKSSSLWDELRDVWTFEDAVLFCVLDSAGRVGVSHRALVNYSMPWGWYSMFPTSHESWLAYSMIKVESVPHVRNPAISCMTLSGIRSTSIVSHKIASMISSLESHPQTSKHFLCGKANLEAFRNELRNLPWRRLQTACEIAVQPHEQFALDSLKKLRRRV